MKPCKYKGGGEWEGAKTVEKLSSEEKQDYPDAARVAQEEYIVISSDLQQE
jgi:hypothetical protein